jgi:hypothetical protein
MIAPDILARDARGEDVLLRTPCCARLVRRALPAVATEQISVRCRKCGARWRVISRPVSASRRAVVRVIEWSRKKGASR